MGPATAITDELHRRGHRITAPRRIVADLIAQHDGPFTAADLALGAEDPGSGVSRATLFRALDLLTELGLVERLDLPSGDHAYVACAPAHHHHVVCSGCGRSTDVADSGLATVVEEVARQSGYRIDVHRLELFGRCPSCQAGMGSAG
jgi:Fur family ferric uptake transcriptional regulator